MMTFKHIIAGLVAFGATFSALADIPFRLHRFDSFKATPVTSDQIVFMGNSITNMHEWWEAFGSDQRIINRGNSGGMSQELLDNLESVLDGKPAKLFLMIGTNDISTGIPYQTVVANIRRIIERTQSESPATEIYIQSILPRVHEPQNTNNKAANAMLAELCEETGVTFIDLWDTLIGIRDYGQWSADGLHLYAAGYRAWCKQIAPYVGDGIKCVYEDSYTNNNNGMANSNGMRVSYFGMLPVKSTDVLIFGDEMIHGGEWHELLRSDRIKNRGICWGYGGLTSLQYKDILHVSLTANGNKENPAKIFFYCGTSDKSSANFEQLLNYANHLSPKPKLYVMPLIPCSNVSDNNAVATYNTAIKNIAAKFGATYVDIYTPLLNAAGTAADPQYITSNYLYGRGYVKVANILAEHLEEEGVNPVSMEEFETLYANRTARNSLFAALDKAASVKFGESTGEYNPDYKPLLESVVAQANAVLTSPQFSTEAAAAAATAINNALTGLGNSLNQPKPSTDGDEHLYTFCSSLRGYYYTTAGTAGAVGNQSTAMTADKLWKFVTRTDGSFDIVNYGTGQYLNPAVAYNTQIALSASAPSRGWTLTYTSTTGMYAIHSGTTCQLNQTNIESKVYNWYGGNQAPDREDLGCQLTVTEFTGEVQQPSTIATGWYEIELANDLGGYVSQGTHHMLNAENEYRQTNTNYYALKFAAPDPDNRATAFIHITANGSTYQFTGLCGHGIKENCTSDRNSLPTENPAVTQTETDGVWSIGKWSNYANDGNESPYVGKMSNSNNTYRITPVEPSVLDSYDIYTVTLKGTTAAAEVGMDPRVGLDIAANDGIRKVYNGGTFFVDKGTTLSYSDFTPDTHAGQSQPEITVDYSAGTITVDYTKSHSSLENIEEAADGDNHTIYDILGRRLSTPSSPGIYLIDGKKVRI